MCLKSISEQLSIDYPIKKDIFTGSTNEWIKRHSNVMKGKIGEELMIKYLSASKSDKKYEYDIQLGDKNIEVKLSCLNETGYFKWLNIRSNDPYTHICLIGILPEDIVAYMIPKQELKHLKTLAQGKRGDGSIQYLGLYPNNKWLLNYKI